jgi:hypothetical protein
MSKYEYGYRRIYEQAHGPIPKDQLGRTYDIHHVDGNHENNDISNLVAVPIQEHYDIHYQSQDYGACVLIGLRMKLSPTEISELNSKSAKKRIAEGSHHFLIGGPRDDLKGDNNPMRRLEVAKKVSDRLTGVPQKITAARLKMWAKRVGTKLNLSEQGRESHRQNGRDKFTKNNPSHQKVTCQYCNKITGKGNHSRWHGNNCKEKK